MGPFVVIREERASPDAGIVGIDEETRIAGVELECFEVTFTDRVVGAHPGRGKLT